MIDYQIFEEAHWWLGQPDFEWPIQRLWMYSRPIVELHPKDQGDLCFMQEAWWCEKRVEVE